MYFLRERVSFCCRCACEWLSLTDLTGRCVWENRASGEHGGPSLKLDTGVSVGSLLFTLGRKEKKTPTHLTVWPRVYLLYAEAANWFVSCQQQQQQQNCGLTATSTSASCRLPPPITLLHILQPQTKWSCDSYTGIPHVTHCCCGLYTQQIPTVHLEV